MRVPLHVKVRKQIARVTCLFLPCGSQGSNSGAQAWHQTSVAIKSFSGLHVYNLKL